MNTIVAVPFDETLAEFIGKKGSTNSITFYNRKLGEHVIVALTPSSIEEKFYAVSQSLVMADQIIVSTKTVDKLFGEVLVGCSLLNKRTIFTKDNDISAILAGVTFNNFTFTTQEELLDLITSHKQEEKDDKSVRIDLDHAFNVKGVGVVALGFVTKGTVKVHDTLYHTSGKSITVRSIQSQDEDVKEAGRGTRVGVALKGIDDTEITKGDVLSTSLIKPKAVLELSVKTSSFANEPIEKGKAYFISTGFSYTNGIVQKVDGEKVSFTLDKPIPAEIGDSFILSRVIAPRMFASGKIISLA